MEQCVTIENHRDKPPSLARRCAQIKQMIRLSKCDHHPSVIYTILGINGDWVQYCIDCGKIVDQG